MSAPILFQQVTVVSPSHRETGPVDVLFCDGRWHFPESARRTIHYQAGGSFFETGRAFDCSGE